jgi:glycosyltransferase involved in cell wall biosynthesis
MLISVCIPHYNRYKYLIAGLESISNQDYPQVEVIISDDCSTDDSSHVIPKYLAALESRCPIRFYYIRQQKNLGYDGNVRASLAAASGDYLFLLGNDDALAKNDTLSTLAVILEKLDCPDVAFTNYYPYGKPDQVSPRAQKTCVIGSGAEVAVRTFRSFSFVSGVVFKRSMVRKYDTSAYDGSIYIQIYLASRIVAAGGTLASIAETMVANNVRISGEVANSYLDVLERDNHKFMRKTGGLDQVGRVACDAILPFVSMHERGRYLGYVYSQILFFSYSYWLYDYRKNGVSRAACNLALGCFPSNLIKGRDVSLLVRVRLLALYGIATAGGLLLPIRLLEKMKGFFYRLSKSL